MSARRVAIIDGCRTPFQRAGTGFGGAMSYQLAEATIRGLLGRNTVAPASIDRVVFGAIVPNARTTNVAREAALDAGLPPTIPSMTVTAAGASATVAVTTAADWITTGRADVVIAGGTDCISDVPIGYSPAMRRKLFAARRLRSLGDRLRFVLSLRPWDFLPDVPAIEERSTGDSMGSYTERLAGRLGIDRESQDAYAARSHRRATRHRDRLREEIVPASIDGTVVDDDNGIRADTTVEALARLRPTFTRDGTLTAGNSSYLTDGASALLLADEARARAEGWPIRAILGKSVLTAHELRDELLLGPVFALPRLLDATGLGLDDLDVIELHEAFAAQILGVLHLLADDTFARQHLDREQAIGAIDPEILNVWGGSLAIGNPFAPNGARLLTTAIHRLHAEDGRLAAVATCAGGGLGHALLVERGPDAY
ncbi:MAG: acetyl-CoA C-acyltransferase [Acidobacteriota bacterium]